MASAKRELPSHLSGTFCDRKYRVAKSDGSPVDHDAKYFVLRFDKDPHAVDAVIAYAASITGRNSRFASDLLQVIYVYAKDAGKLKPWAEAAHSLSYLCRAPQEEADRLLLRVKIEASVEDGPGDGE